MAFGEAAHKSRLNLNVEQKIWNETDLNSQGELGHFRAKRERLAETLTILISITTDSPEYHSL
jgi:hypothetical protein